MTLLDLIVLVIVGVFIYTRFFGHKLPKDLQKKAKKSASKMKAGQILDFPKETVEKAAPKPKKPKVDLSQYEGIDQVKAADNSFSEHAFLKGAKTAYEFYYDAWNRKDDEALANFLSPQLMDDAVETFNEMDKKGQSPKIEVSRVSGEVVDGRVHGRTAIVDVKFTAEQSENIVDDKEKVVGKKKPAKEVVTIWTFARIVDADDPNWELEKISRPS